MKSICIKWQIESEILLKTWSRQQCSSAVKNLRIKSKLNSNWSILNMVKDETAAQLINSPAVLVLFSGCWGRGGGGLALKLSSISAAEITGAARVSGQLVPKSNRTYM